MAFPQRVRGLLNYLPVGLRHELLRRSFSLNYEWPVELKLKLASTPSELESAFRLAHDYSIKSGGISPDPTGMLIHPQHLMPQAVVLIAMWNDRVVGTASLIRENPMGLPIRSQVSEARYATQGQRLAELTSFAIDPAFYTGLSQVFFPLMKFVFRFARDRFGVHRILVSVPPATVEMYEAVLGFRKVQGGPDNLLCVDTGRYLEDLARLYEGHSASTDLSRYFSASSAARHFELPERDFYFVDESIMSPRLMESLFFEKGKMLERLDEAQKRVLAQQYPHAAFTRVLGLQEAESRTEKRVETHLPVRIGLTRGLSEIWDVSSNGLRLSTSERLDVGNRLTLRIYLNRSVQATVEAEVKWVSKDRTYGLKVESANASWTTMTKALEARWSRVVANGSGATEAKSLA